MIIKARLLKLVLMLLLLIPLGYLAACGVHHTRPEGGFQFFFSREDKDYLTFQWPGDTDASFGKFATFEIESKPVPSQREAFLIKDIGIGRVSKDVRYFVENGVVWVTKRTGDTSAAIHQFDLTNNDPPQTISIDFGESIFGDSMMFLIDGKLIRRPNEQLEMWDISTGSILDSIATPSAPNSYFYKIAGTQNILVVDPSTSFAGLYGLNGEKLRLVQEWKSLETISFQRNGESLVASLLPNGANIEVRSAKDGSVVSNYSVPIDPALPLPLSSFELDGTGSFFRWRSIDICTDVITGQTLPMPDSFDLLVRNLNDKRLIAIRNESSNGMTVSKECVVIDETTTEQLKRFRLDLNEKVNVACVLKKSGHLALATYDQRVHLYDLETGNLVRTIDLFRWGFPLNCAAAILFGLWCIVWVRISATVHPYAWIDSSVCIGLFVAYATYRFVVELYSPADTTFIFASLGVLLAATQLTTVWLCLGRNRLFLRTAPFVLTIGLTAGLVTYWHARPNVASAMVAGLMPLTVGTILALAILRWSGMKFESVLSRSFEDTDSVLQKESSIHLRDLFLFTLAAAIVAAVVRSVPVSYWYGILFDQRMVRPFLVLVCIFAACLAAVVVMSLWTSFSRRNVFVRWLPWLIALFLFQLITLGPFGPFFFGAVATMMTGLHAYRLRGWRFRPKHFATSPT